MRRPMSMRPKPGPSARRGEKYARADAVRAIATESSDETTMTSPTSATWDGLIHCHMSNLSADICSAGVRSFATVRAWYYESALTTKRCHRREPGTK